ncbi:hypothetical protein [Deferribacter autotrophicus]|nr:hypothetical protein [Deferribacter autotrophicus]
MLVMLNEKIKVGAIFYEGFPKPVWFIYYGTKIFIKKIIYQWKEREGRDVIYKYTVTEGENIYELSFSRENLEWCLVAIDEGKY